MLGSTCTPVRQVLRIAMVAVPALAMAGEVSAQEGFHFSGDRNGGVPVSMFGTYIRPGELLFYSFYEYYTNHDEEYSPNELGFGLDRDFRAQSRGHEFLVFLGYGVSDRLALEFEAALYTTAYQDKASGDPSEMPSRIEESGLGDVEGQVRWRWARESESGPGIFSFFEYVLPLQKDKVLIGTQHWELKFGTGLVRAFSFGTLSFRVAAEYDGADDKVEPGEIALEFVKRLSTSVRVFAAVEGTEDEWEFIPVLMWSPHPRAALHLNSAFGFTSKVDDWAPEIGIMISLP